MRCKNASLLIFGGSFDPPHKVHISMLNGAVSLLKPEKILIVPAWQSPFKTGHFAPFRLRKEMLALALEGKSFSDICEISDFEFRKKRKTYTWQLISFLKKKYPESELFFLMGSDSFINFHLWKRANYIKRNCKLIVAPRKGFEVKKREGAIFLEKIYPNHSSTEFRERALFLDFSLLPEAVAGKVLREGIYFTDILSGLKNILSKKRFFHTSNVALLALRLANIHDIDSSKAVLAALVHDCARELPLRKQKELALKEFSPELVEVLALRAPGALHQFASVRLAKERFNIKDKKILRAAAWHSTGLKKPSKLDKLLFICDFASFDRRHGSAAEVRRLAEKDLDKAFQRVRALKGVYLNRKGLEKVSL